MRFSRNAPPTGWPAVYSSILDLDHFVIELVLAAANQNNCHKAAEVVAVFRLTTIVASKSCSRPKFCTIKMAWNRARLATQGVWFSTTYHLHLIKIPSHLSAGNSYIIFILQWNLTYPHLDYPAAWIIRHCLENILINAHTTCMINCMPCKMASSSAKCSSKKKKGL